MTLKVSDAHNCKPGIFETLNWRKYYFLMNKPSALLGFLWSNYQSVLYFESLPHDISIDSYGFTSKLYTSNAFTARILHLPTKVLIMAACILGQYTHSKPFVDSFILQQSCLVFRIINEPVSMHLSDVIKGKTTQKGYSFLNNVLINAISLERL